MAQLGKVLAEKPDEAATNGEVFDREAYLRYVQCTMYINNTKVVPQVPQLSLGTSGLI